MFVGFGIADVDLLSNLSLHLVLHISKSRFPYSTGCVLFCRLTLFVHTSELKSLNDFILSIMAFARVTSFLTRSNFFDLWLYLFLSVLWGTKVYFAAICWLCFQDFIVDFSDYIINCFVFFFSYIIGYL